MHLNSIRSYPAGYDCPPLPTGLCSHRDLADLLLHYLAWAPPAIRPPVSDEGIRRAIELAFFASMAPEEGRYPRFSVVCQEDFGAPFTVTRFDSIAIDDVDVLRRVAPSCTLPECALLVTHRDGRLWCDGVVNVGPMGYDTKPGRPEFLSGGGRPSIRIDVRGAGHMIVRSGFMAYELRAGKIRYLCDYWNVPGVKSFREEVSQYLEQEIIRREGEDARTFFGGHSKGSVPILVMLSRMLRVAVDACHGGTFVIIPTDLCDSDSYDIRLKYTAKDLDFGLDMIGFYCACVDAARKHLKDGYERAIDSWTHLKARMLIAAETVGNLSCVDGCVVLNRRLQLCGFGGEILVSDEKARQSPRRFENYMTGEAWNYDSFLKGIGGTRHKSAARLCKAFDGVLAFIVSQDGELKILSSDAEKVNAFGPVDVPFAGHQPPVGMA